MEGLKIGKSFAYYETKLHLNDLKRIKMNISQQVINFLITLLEKYTRWDDSEDIEKYLELYSRQK